MMIASTDQERAYDRNHFTVTTRFLEADDPANPARTLTVSCFYQNMDDNQQLGLFMCRDMCAEKAKKKSLYLNLTLSPCTNAAP